MPRGWIIAILAVFAGLLFPGEARAQAGLVGTHVPICVVRALPGMTPAGLMTDPDRFACGTPQRHFGSGDFWVSSRPISASLGATRNIRVRFASLWQDRLTLYARYADGFVSTRVLDGRGLSRRIQLGAIMEVPLETRHAPLVQLLWHVEGATNTRAIMMGVTLATPRDSTKSNLTMAAIYAAFGGLAVALFVYNLALWFVLRHRFQLAYCAMLACLGVYALSSSGALAWAWPDIANNDRIRLNYVMLAASASAALVFARCFFERRVFDGFLRPLSSVTAAALIGSSLLVAVAAPWQMTVLDKLYAAAFALLLVTAAIVLWRGWTQRSNYLWLFAIAWAAPIALATLRVAGNLQLLQWSFWVDNSTILAMATEALLSSVAIAYRIRLLSKERDEAREQEVAARLLADMDPLTGLLNRRGFLREAIGRTGEHALFIVDIDHFKRINDTLGHDGGDEVLRIVARALRAVTPAGAIVARIGGEEFAILSGIFTPLIAEDVLGRIRAERMPFDVTVTASIGSCAGTIESDSTWKSLYRLADRALFEAKAAGRDRARSAAAA
jgi:diguanylate cyclase (GGDEF)-like protein